MLCHIAKVQLGDWDNSSVLLTYLPLNLFTSALLNVSVNTNLPFPSRVLQRKLAHHDAPPALQK